MLRKHLVKYMNADLKWFSLLMSFNSILIGGLNLSLLVFIFFYSKYTKFVNLLKVRYTIQWIAVAFFIGALCSALDVNTPAENGTQRAFTVLPNYLYWVLLIIVMVNIRFYIEWRVVAFSLFLGLAITVLQYHFFQTPLPFLKVNYPNSYAFILVCFSAMAVTSVFQKYNRLYAVVVMALLVFSLLSIERRAGFVLVTASSMAALFVINVKPKNLIVPLLLLVLVYGVLQNELVEQGLYQSSPRIHELIYESDAVIEEDRSYLTRRLMIERGLVSFGQHPLTGIGLNNMSVAKIINTDGNFVGSEFVLQKLDDKQLSAHNSYLHFLIEGGLLVLVPFVLLILFNVFAFVRYYNLRSMTENSFYWGFIAMCFHLYVISEIINVYAWFLIGCVSALSIKYSVKNVTKPTIPKI